MGNSFLTSLLTNTEVYIFDLAGLSRYTKEKEGIPLCFSISGKTAVYFISSVMVYPYFNLFSFSINIRKSTRYNFS